MQGCCAAPGFRDSEIAQNFRPKLKFGARFSKNFAPEIAQIERTVFRVFTALTASRAAGTPCGGGVGLCRAVVTFGEVVGETRREIWGIFGPKVGDFGRFRTKNRNSS